MFLIRKALSRLVLECLYWSAYLGLLFQSAWRTLWLAGVPPQIRIDSPPDGRPILLIALYQKGRLRDDTRRLLHAARSAGYHILGVNTLRLPPGSSDVSLFDCYIERVNFGRDFGSYRDGFRHVFTRGWHRGCPRLVMVNDSVFVSSRGLDGFLADLRDTPLEVLGATENYEVEYHLGSFCISIGPAILESQSFRDFWNAYKLTDVRPKVIARGEMRLSRLLKRLVSSPDQFSALYGAERFTQALTEDSDLVAFALRNGRTSALTHWKRVDYAQIVSRLQQRAELQLALECGPTVAAFTTLDRFEMQDEKGEEPGAADWRSAAMERLVASAELAPDIERGVHIALLSDVFIEGSQIHQNAAVLLRMGLPIVKLDGLYRGMFNLYDVGAICKVLPAEEQRTLRALLIERPFGADTYTGWKRAAFLRGLI